MKGTDYRQLIEDEATKSGTDPAEALKEFRELVRKIDAQREMGAVCQEEKLKLSAHYDFHYKHIALPEGVEPIPLDRLSERYGVWKHRQRKANQSVVILTSQVNKLLPKDTQLKTPNRSHPKGGGDDGS